jgi:cbb3-type cytochrome oxidase subunit 3
MGILFSAWTVLVALVFFAIVVWVLRENKENFDEAARIPFEEDAEPHLDQNKEEIHG